MLINKLLLSVRVEHNREPVKAADYPMKLEAVHEEHRYHKLVFSNLIEEAILEILRFLHFSQLLFLGAVLLSAAPS